MACIKKAVALSGLAAVAPALELTLGDNTTLGDDSCAVSDYDKSDCKGMTEDDCNSKGCCWSPAGEGSTTPWCYFKKGQGPVVPHCSLKADPKAPFSDDDIAQIRQLFEANLDIQNSGMVVAAPDHNTGPGGDYYYAWMRDGALSMHALLETSATFDDDVAKKMDDWIGWVERSMKEAPVGDRDIMAEPKFVIPSGEPFPGSWCRPQNDGPGLRAITLMAYVEKKPDVASRAWNSIQKELDWVVEKYDSNGCDLWEEVQSNDFFWNRYTMRKALLQGAKFATAQGDNNRASTYSAKAKEIEDKLKVHTEADGFVFESENRKQDTATIHAFNSGDMNDGLYAPLSNEAVTTFVGLTQAFCKEYSLNQQAASNGIPGVLYGRYPGDTYDGGNPWILLSSEVAHLLYRQSMALSKGATIADDVAAKMKGIVGDEITAKSLLGAGDSIFNRMRTFLTNGLHMNEQIARDDGHLTSAKDLTWNYANVLKAMKARKAAADAMTADTTTADATTTDTTTADATTADTTTVDAMTADTMTVVV